MGEGRPTTKGEGRRVRVGEREGGRRREEGKEGGREGGREEGGKYSKQGNGRKWRP